MELQEFDWSDIIWKTNKKRWINSLHAMCSYLAMFPPSLPNYLIKQFSQPGEVVFDPFSGRGTAPLEACLNGRIGIGNDLSPLARILTGAKVNVPQLQNVTRRINQLEDNYTYTDVLNVEPNIKMLYDEEVTLPQLVYLKNNLKIKNKVDQFIMGSLLGIMHGKIRKDGTSMYLSISMPNTFSMSPNYIRNYIEKNNINKIKNDVFEALRYKVNLLYKEKSNNYVKGKAYGFDAMKINYNRRIFKENYIDLIITSPPYLQVINYGTYNWIRLWMLNNIYDSEEINEKLKSNKVYTINRELKLKDELRLKEYLEFMKEVILGWERILKEDGMAFVIIGDVSNYNNKYIKLAEEVWKYAKNYTSLKLIDIIEDKIDTKTKVTKIWGNKKRGEATKIDRILILSKGNGRMPNYTTNIRDHFSYFYK
ncbi:DNA methyltransferase [Clostridium aestuarii]|uniref:site-specific DNA-methyltransferase (cytosine-N(4)-specific) n=1 Tax=Clostridium aestuarii TaxID=338193 RepID=A0ABT4CXR7_9CLOT|nr:DNA methyltransferase [Clostridium aestuarii]MCY6483799.1 DNA methyltransferase [Clostridium aestuarii]